MELALCVVLAGDQVGSTGNCEEEVFHTPLRGPEVFYIVRVTPTPNPQPLDNPLPSSLYPAQQS